MNATDTLTPVTDPARLRSAFARIPQGVTAVCGLPADGRPRGMAASSLTSVSLEPPMILLCAANTSSTWGELQELPRIGVSVLSAAQNDTCRALAARGVDRFADVGWRATTDGAVLLDEAVLWMDCSIERELPAGDHRVVLLRIEAMGAGPVEEPLVFHDSRFRSLAAAAG